MEIQRPFWQALIRESWQQRPIVWLMGVRRLGKTSLCKSLDPINYFDCEIPGTRKLLSDPEAFLESQKGNYVAIDEIHRLDNPSELLKIAADHYKSVKIIATGSSTLGASAKFKDTLTGRKFEIWLTPLLLQELEAFGSSDIRHRFLFGGFPDFFVSKQEPEKYFQEWIDSYWAKDIQEIFSVGKRSAFQKFTELLLANSGGLFEATRYTAPCEISRATVANYLNVLEETFIVHIIRPFSSHKPTEIVSAPKVYGFDTGFINYVKSRTTLRDEDLGFMWEHCVLNEMHAHLQTRSINYWRNKSGNEIDFVHRGRGDKGITAIECKFSSLHEDADITSLCKNFTVFRELYPNGENFVVSYNITTPFKRRYKDLSISFVGTKELVEYLKQRV